MVGKKEPKIPLTKAEKAQRRRAKKLLAKQIREEKKRQVRRDYLARELNYCRLNREKCEKGWKMLLSDIKIKELQMEFEFHVNQSERILDYKDMEISLLLDELDMADEQYEFNLEKYIINFDSIVDALEQSLNNLKDQYDSDLKHITISAEEEASYQKKLDDERELNLRMAVFGLKKNIQTETNETKSRYLSLLKEEEDRTTADIVMTQSHLERRFERTWRSYKDTISEYKLENRKTKKRYEILHNQDTFMRKWIKEQTHQLFKAYDKIYLLKFEQNQEKDAIDLKLKSKMEEHQFFVRGFHTLKQRLKEDLNTDQEQTKNVVKYCNESIKLLKKFRNKGESILKLNGICRKYETAEELISPYPEFSPAENVHSTRAVSVQIKMYKEKKMLDLFLQRCGQGDAMRKILYEEAKHFKHENLILRDKLHTACSTNETCSNMKTNDDTKDEIIKYLCVKSISAE